MSKNLPGKIPIGILIERYIEVERNGKCIMADYKSALDQDLVVDAGLNWLCTFFDVATNNENPMRYIAIGESGSAPAASDTALGSESMRQSAAYTKAGTAGLANLWTQFSVDDTYALYECGILNSDTGGTLYARDTYTVKNVISGDTVRVSYNIQFTAA